mmetsp:Transcript_45512/g.117635  ORF Transcript_45512/g.117635 Transcript_45512/m.117635 type:complete len:196 (-) Transcript_45512:317-904(-)
MLNKLITPSQFHSYSFASSPRQCLVLREVFPKAFLSRFFLAHRREDDSYIVVPGDRQAENDKNWRGRGLYVFCCPSVLLECIEKDYFKRAFRNQRSKPSSKIVVPPDLLSQLRSYYGWKIGRSLEELHRAGFLTDFDRSLSIGGSGVMQVSFGPRSCTNEKVVEVFKLSSDLFPFLSTSAQLKVDLERFEKVARQ